MHERGTFVYRLAGRERQQSASYYTPEVLTRFTVSQALEELLDQDGHTTTAEEILGLTVCEPALGSGAFAIEAVRQLAEQYLRRRQAELGERIDPESYPTELQRVKASIALHQVYGVDLNATAVELAEISLWLDTMVSGLQAPWFGLRLRRGNSLIGARRAVYTRAQVNDRSWLKATPADVPMTGMVEEMQRRDDRAADRGPDPPLPAARERLGLGGGGKGGQRGSRPRPGGRGGAEEVALSDHGQAVSEAAQRLGGTRSPGGISVAVDAAPLGDRRVRGSARHQAVGPRRSWPSAGGHPGADRADSGHAERRVPTPAPGHGCLGSPMVLAPHRHRWRSPAHPGPLDRGMPGASRPRARGSQEEPGQASLGAVSNWEDFNAAEDLNLGFAGATDVGHVLDRHPWLKVCEGRSPARLLPLGSRLRNGIRQRRLRPPDWQSAVGPTANRPGRPARRGRSVVAVVPKPKRGSPHGKARGDSGATGNPQPRH